MIGDHDRFHERPAGLIIGGGGRGQRERHHPLAGRRRGVGGYRRLDLGRAEALAKDLADGE